MTIKQLYEIAKEKGVDDYHLYLEKGTRWVLIESQDINYITKLIAIKGDKSHEQEIKEGHLAIIEGNIIGESYGH